MHVDPAPATYVGTILTAVRSFNQSRIFGVLDDADASHGVDTTIDEIIFPSLRVVGTFWSSGTIDVAHEHLLSTAVARWVAAKSAVLPQPSRKGTVLLSAGPQDMHTLALDCLDLLLASRGVEVCNLGAQTPGGVAAGRRPLGPPDGGRAVLAHPDRRQPGRPLGQGRGGGRASRSTSPARPSRRSSSARTPPASRSTGPCGRRPS